MVAFTVDSQQHDVSLLDFFENVSEALEGLSEAEKRTARLNLRFRRMLDGDGHLNDVAVLNVVNARDETDEELADRQEQASRQAAVNQSLREARDRIEFARLRAFSNRHGKRHRADNRASPSGERLLRVRLRGSMPSSSRITTARSISPRGSLPQKTSLYCRPKVNEALTIASPLARFITA